jgi:hypothetical protein
MQTAVKVWILCGVLSVIEEVSAGSRQVAGCQTLAEARTSTLPYVGKAARREALEWVPLAYMPNLIRL